MDVQEVKEFVLKYFLIIGLLTVIAFGLICPEPGLAMGRVKASENVAVSLIFVVSGLCLDSASDALKAKALTIGIVLVLIVTPMLAWPVLWLKDLDSSLNAKLLQGMALFTVVPTTLSSGVTMISQAKGNVSLAILLTSVTNVLGVFTMSLSASRVFDTSVHVDPKDLLAELIWLTLVPLCVGMALRRFVPIFQEFAEKNKKPMSLLQNSCVLFVVWLMISKAQEQIFIASAKDLGLCITLAAFVHLAYRVLGSAVATAAQLPPREWVTIVLMCSQKALAVCVSVLAALPQNEKRDTGLYILPCIIAHAAQLIIDSILAVRWQVKAESVQTPLLDKDELRHPARRAADLA